MTAVWAWARRELHRRRRSAIALVLLLGISGAVALTAAAGARRTGTAFERFLEDAIIGIPVGVAIGRVAWKLVADGIGVAAEGATAGPIVLVVMAGALAASLLLAVLPGRAAASRHAVDALRVE